MPRRMVRTRNRGGSPPGAVYVGRPTMWGNPFRLDEMEDAAGEFRRWLLDPSRKDHAERRREILRSIRRLRGKDLSCWCEQGAPCHADTLLELANRHRNVMQTTPTNCFAACIATILDIPIETVPITCDARFWDYDNFQRWLAAEHDMQAVEVVIGPASIVPVQKPVPCILTGESPRDALTGLHAVVGSLRDSGFWIKHDPHESQGGIQGEPKYVLFFVKT